jgi:hypothetical protein
MPFILEQSHAEIYASAGGLAVVGLIINRHSGLKKRLKSVPLRPWHRPYRPTRLGAHWATSAR